LSWDVFLEDLWREDEEQRGRGEVEKGVGEGKVARIG